MSIIDEIKLYVKHGKLPIVQDDEKDYAIVTVVDNDIYVISNYENDIKKLELGNNSYQTDKNEIENNEWKIVGQYDIPTVPFAVGQKVKVREDLGEMFDISEWKIIKKEMIGKIFTIAEVTNDFIGLHYSLGSTGGYIFRHEWLLPVIETKRTVDDVLAGLSDEDKEIIKERLR